MGFPQLDSRQPETLFSVPSAGVAADSKYLGTVARRWRVRQNGLSLAAIEQLISYGPQAKK